MTTLDEQARTLYDACETPKQAWTDLSETTKNVWRAYVNRDKDWPFLYKIGNTAAEQAREALLRNAADVVRVVPREVITLEHPMTDPQVTFADEALKAGGVVTFSAPLGEPIVPVTTLENVLEKIPARPLTLKEKLALKGLK